jgi:hypothetical protein
MAVHGARQRIEAEVLTWPGVVSQTHRFGGTESASNRRGSTELRRLLRYNNAP